MIESTVNLFAAHRRYGVRNIVTRASHAGLLTVGFAP
jgi:hypothetical protein